MKSTRKATYKAIKNGRKMVNVCAMRKAAYKTIKDDRKTANVCAILICATPIALMYLMLVNDIVR